MLMWEQNELAPTPTAANTLPHTVTSRQPNLLVSAPTSGPTRSHTAVHIGINIDKLCVRLPQYAPPHASLTFDLMTLKMVSESLVTWATSVPILVFLCLSVLDLGPMYATDKYQTDVRRASSPNAPAMGAGHNKAAN